MHVLIVGASGFIGCRLSEALIAKGHDVVCLSRTLHHAPGCEVRIAAAGDIQAMRAAVADDKVDAVINLAAAGVHPGERDTAKLIATNAVMPPELVQVAAHSGARAFIQIGSSAEYARSDDLKPLVETSALERYSLYGASKAAGSLLAQASGKKFDVPVAVIRPFNVFGPGEKPHRLLPSLVAALSRGERVALSSGVQVRDFIFIDDACAAIVRMLEALSGEPRLSGEYNLGCGTPCTVAAFAEAVARAANADPALLDFGRIAMRPDDLPYVVADIAKLERVIGPLCKHSLQETVQTCVDDMALRACA